MADQPQKGGLTHFGICECCITLVSYVMLIPSNFLLWSAKTTAGHLSIPGRWHAAQRLPSTPPCTEGAPPTKGKAPTATVHVAMQESGAERQHRRHGMGGRAAPTPTRQQETVVHPPTAASSDGGQVQHT